MKNICDFTLDLRNKTASAATEMVVLLDGQMCPNLDVVEIDLGAAPCFGQVKLQFVPDDERGIRGKKDLVSRGIQEGCRISICRPYDGGVGGSNIELLGIFEGFITQISWTTGSSDYGAEIIARDASIELEGINVCGRRLRSRDGSVPLDMIGPVIFNAGDADDRDEHMVERNGSEYPIFAADGSSLKWTAADIVQYVLREYVQPGLIALQPSAELERVFAGTEIGEFSAEGESVVDVLVGICARADVRFKFVSRFGNDGPTAGIVFYRDTCSRVFTLNMQDPGQALDSGRTNVWQMNDRIGTRPVTQQYTVLGERKRYEATFNLVRAWDPALEGMAADAYATGSPSFETVRNVYRRWCLNEAGDYSGPPYEQGPACDLAKLFGKDDYFCRRRKFLETINALPATSQAGFGADVSFDSGVSWQTYADSFEVLTDECGIWLSGSELDPQIMQAASADSLRFRITACLESDERLTGRYADGPVGGSFAVRETVERTDEYRFRQVSSMSILAGTGKGGINDTCRINQYAREKCLSLAAEEMAVAVDLMSVGVGLEPGGEMKFYDNNRGNNGDVKYFVERVGHDLMRQSTKLILTAKRGVEK